MSFLRSICQRPETRDRLAVDGALSLTYAELESWVAGYTERLKPILQKKGQAIVWVYPELATKEALGTLLALIELNAIIEFSCESKETEIECSQNAETPLVKTLVDQKKSGFLLRTSGTTGDEKLVLHDLGFFLERYADDIEHPRKPYRILSTYPLGHLGGLDSLLRTWAQGGCFILPEEPVTPTSLSKIIERYQVEVLPATPSFLRLWMLQGACGTPAIPDSSFLISEEEGGGQRATQPLNNSSSQPLKVIVYGAEVMPDSLLLRLGERLPGVRLRPRYGSSEFGVLDADSDENGGSGFRIADGGFRIVEGELFLPKPKSLLGYVNQEMELSDEWLPTGDQAEVSADGTLKILGRKSNLINVGGLKVVAEDVESTLLALDKLEDVLVFAESHPLLGQVVCARIRAPSFANGLEVKRYIRSELGSRLPRHALPVTVELVDEIACNAVGKKVRLRCR